MEDFQSVCKNRLVKTYNKMFSDVRINLDNVFIVWACKTLQNYKALASTTVDGDGEYELIVKWDPSNSHDNSHDGYTGDVILDCYKFDGTQLWRINLGKNIRAGAHYTQFLVFDFDGDGKSEMICKTSAGSIDGQGRFVSESATDAEIRSLDNAADYRNRRGRIKNGAELLTVFNGETGKSMQSYSLIC